MRSTPLRPITNYDLHGNVVGALDENMTSPHCEPTPGPSQQPPCCPDCIAYTSPSGLRFMVLPNLSRVSTSLLRYKTYRWLDARQHLIIQRESASSKPATLTTDTVRSFSTRASVLLQQRPTTAGEYPVPPSLRELQHLEKPLENNSKLQDDFDDVEEGRGKLSPTSSHLFKLILPLGGLDLDKEQRKSLYAQSTATSSGKPTHRRPPPPTIMLLHPAQPLSHVASLIRHSIRHGSDKSRRARPGPDITFVSTSTRGQLYQWSETTDIGDFVRDAARKRIFWVELDFSESEPKNEATADSSKANPLVTRIEVDVPTFHDRTSFLRRRLFHIQAQLKQMEGLKTECDSMAHRGAKRVAIGGFGMLIVYWGAVARLTFWDYGWDVMEPVTYLSGLTTVVCGYLYFLYQGRDVSYTSVLARSVNARREALYKIRGFDVDRWTDLKEDERSIRREIGRIAEEYDVDTEDGETEEGKKTGDNNDGESEERDDIEGDVNEKVKRAGDEVGKSRGNVEDAGDEPEKMDTRGKQ